MVKTTQEGAHVDEILSSSVILVALASKTFAQGLSCALFLAAPQDMR